MEAVPRHRLSDGLLKLLELTAVQCAPGRGNGETCRGDGWEASLCLGTRVSVISEEPYYQQQLLVAWQVATVG